VLSRLTTPGPLLALGLGATTVAGSLWIATANRSLDPHATNALLSFYFLVGTIGTGVLAGLEQEMTRTVARTHAVGRPVGAAVRGQLRQAVGLAAVTVVVLLAASPLLLSHWLQHSWAMEAALVAGLAATWASFLVRGVLAGCQDFRYYSLTLVVQGVATIVPSLCLALAGHGHLLGYAFVFALAPLVAAVSGVASPALRRSWRASGVASGEVGDGAGVGAEAGVAAGAEAGAGGAVVLADEVVAAGDGLEMLPTAAEAEASEPAGEPGGSLREKLILLTLATLVSQLLINAVPLVIGPRLVGSGPHGAAVGQSLNSSMGLSRLALLCLFPLQAPLLPLLAAAAARHDFREVRRKTGFLVAACLGAGALGVVVVAAAGPWLLTDYFNTSAPLSRLFLAALALSTGFLMTAFVLQSAQVALHRHRVVFASWLAGLVVMALVFALPLAPLTSAAWAGILGPLVVTVIAAADVMFVTRSAPAPGTVDSVAAERADGADSDADRDADSDADSDAAHAAPVAEGVRS
jgi:O-antigen/teichoic acid export membrane protein